MKKGFYGLLLLLVVATAVLATYEIRTSHFQARYFSQYASTLNFDVAAGPSDHIVYPAHGPHNQRAGYVQLPEMLRNLEAHGYEIAAQSRFSQPLMDYVQLGGNPVYREKPQAGLNIFDDAGAPLYTHRQPERVYRDFDEIPPLLVNTLLFIENRELLQNREPQRNPAV